MQICLYDNHHQLPCIGNEKKQPEIVFNQGMNKLRLELARGNYLAETPLSEHYFWNMFLALDKIQALRNTKELLAHVSLRVDIAANTFAYPKRVWIIITTHSNSTIGPNRIPMLFDLNDNYLVGPVWSSRDIDDNSASPLDLLPVNDPKELEGDLTAKLTPNVWEDFFAAEIGKKKRAEIEAADEQIAFWSKIWV